MSLARIGPAHLATVSLPPARSAPRPWSHGPALYRLVLAGWVGLLAYGSLLPWDMAMPQTAGTLLPQWDADLAFWRVLAGHSRTLRSDLAMNVLAYLPVGLLAVLAGEGRRYRPLRLVRLAMAAAILSLSLETAQGLIEGRVGTLNDVLANVTGAVAGMALAGPAVTAARRGVFWLYCRLAQPWRTVRALVGRERHQATLAALVSGAALVILALIVAGRAVPKAQSADAALWPLVGHFDQVYHHLATGLARGLMLYLALAGLWAVQFLSLRRARGLATVLVLTVGGALAVELLTLFGDNQPMDLTQPALAAAAVAALATMVVLAQRAIRVSCRRKVSLPVPVDRRCR